MSLLTHAPIDFDERPGLIVIRPRFPRLDALTAPSFREVAGAKVVGMRVVILDLSDVAAADSSGLGSIVSLVKKMPAGGSLRLACISEPIRVLLELTRMNRVLRTFADVAGAAND